MTQDLQVRCITKNNDDYASSINKLSNNRTNNSERQIKGNCLSDYPLSERSSKTSEVDRYFQQFTQLTFSYNDTQGTEILSV